MAKSTLKSNSINSTRQIIHTRLYDDSALENKYQILNKLGEGSFGIVYRVRSKENYSDFAMKTIAKKSGNKIKSNSLENEVQLLKEVNHPNLIQLHEVLESSQNVYLIVELCQGGELGIYVKKFGCLPESTVKQIISKLVSALYYLHRMDIVHRDLKLENILLRNVPTSNTDDFDIRITDFGLSSKKSITSTDSLFNDYCGTPLYMAPEILDNKNYSALCDVWALGIIMYYLLTGRHPYVASDERRLLETIRSHKLRYDSNQFENLSAEGLDFVQGMLIYDTVHRRTMGELTVHPWLTGRSDKMPSKDIITMMKEFRAENDHKETNEEKHSEQIETNLKETKFVESSRISSSTHLDKDSNRNQKFSSNQSRSVPNSSDRRHHFDSKKFSSKPIRLAPDPIKKNRNSTNSSERKSSDQVRLPSDQGVNQSK